MTQTIVYDFSKLATEETVEELKSLLDSKLPENVSILVNNVGMCKVGVLHKHSIWNCLTSINVNINSQTYMTHIMLPKLLERKSRSAIINLSSIGARRPAAIYPTYNASKAYVQCHSLCLHDAYKDKIDVLAVQPHGCST